MAGILDLKTERLDGNWISIVQEGKLEVVETAPGGLGKVSFNSPGPTLHLKHYDNKPPLRWAMNRRCADGAIIVEGDEGLCLHVVELKSRLTRKEWSAVKVQFEGMIAYAIAALAVIDGPRPAKVICHVSYNSESVTSTETADLVLLKLPLGGGSQYGEVEDWTCERLSLFGYSDVALKKIPRHASTGEGFGNLAA